MSQFWSIFIIAIVLINIVGCVWLLWWTARRKKIDSNLEQTTGHVWDGDLTEYNKPLPRWWINLFYITIVFALIYIAIFPGFGRFQGYANWSASKQHAEDQLAADQRFAQMYDKYAEASLTQIAKDADAMKAGRNLFTNNCAQCHGSDARGAKGYPNLTDDVWLWGGSEEQILNTILNGRTAAMPPLAAVVGDPAAVTAVAAHVQSLSGIKVDPGLAALGKRSFESVCAACHGAQGKGNVALGAPNLTDSDWLYGRDIESIKYAINNGRAGQMPAFEPILGPLRSRLLAAYVVSLRNHTSENSPTTTGE